MKLMGLEVMVMGHVYPDLEIDVVIDRLSILKVHRRAGLLPGACWCASAAARLVAMAPSISKCQ